jgi:hypothetical protein
MRCKKRRNPTREALNMSAQAQFDINFVHGDAIVGTRRLITTGISEHP